MKCKNCKIKLTEIHRYKDNGRERIIFQCPKCKELYYRWEKRWGVLWQFIGQYINVTSAMQSLRVFKIQTKPNARIAMEKRLELIKGKWVDCGTENKRRSFCFTEGRMFVVPCLIVMPFYMALDYEHFRWKKNKWRCL